jgi:hypothetical protein
VAVQVPVLVLVLVPVPVLVPVQTYSSRHKKPYTMGMGHSLVGV